MSIHSLVARLHCISIRLYRHFSQHQLFDDVVVTAAMFGLAYFNMRCVGAYVDVRKLAD